MVFRTLAKFSKRTPLKRSIRESQEWYEEEPQERSSEFKTEWKIIKQRRSIRKYQSRDVRDSLLLDIIEAASYAPSEGNLQPWEFIIVKNPTIKKHLIEACHGQTWMLGAPVLIVVCINMRLAGSMYGERGEKLYGIQAVAAAIENMLLAAESLGLGTCWVGSFSEHKTAIAVHCPDYIRPCAVVTVGWPAEHPPQPVVQPLKEIVHIEKFGETILHREIMKGKSKLIR